MEALRTCWTCWSWLGHLDWTIDRVVVEKMQVAGERRVSRAAGMLDVLSLKSLVAFQNIYCRGAQASELYVGISSVSDVEC